MSLIDKDFFVYPIYLATSETADVVLLDRIIVVNEAKYLALITYDSGTTSELADVKNMIGYFTYSNYIEEQIRLNTSIGTMNLKTDSSVKVSNIDNAYERYNDAVDLFNTYVTDSADEITDYKNSLGI